MRSFEQRGGKKDQVRLFLKRLGMFAIFAAAIFLAKASWNLYGKSADARMGKQEAAVQLADLQMRQADLQAKIADLRSSRGMEARLREQYGLGREGEGVIVIVDEKPPPPPPPAAFPSIRWFEELFIQ